LAGLTPRGKAVRRFSGTLNLILIWILFSLLAIAYIGTRPFVGLAIAVIGGIILGVASFLDFEARQREEWARRQQEMEETPGTPEADDAVAAERGPGEPAVEDSSE